MNLKLLALCTLGLFLLPTAVAFELISVSTERWTRIHFERPVGETYSFSFSNPPFDGAEQGNGSIARFVLELNYDMPEISNGQTVNANTVFRVSNLTKSFEFNYASHASRTSGFNNLYNDLRDENGTILGSNEYTESFSFGAFDYHTSHVLVYAENATGRVRPDGADEFSDWRNEQNFSGGALFYVMPQDGDDVFESVDQDTFWYEPGGLLWHLADIDGPLEISASTYYPEVGAENLQITYKFLTPSAAAREDESLDCGGPNFLGFKPANAFRGLFGFCPSITELISRTMGFVATGIDFLLLPFPDGLRTIFRAIVTLFEELIGIYLSPLLLISSAPVKTIVVYVVLVITYSFLTAAATGDVRDVWAGFKGGIMGFARFAVVYVKTMWTIITTAIELFRRAIEVVVNAVL